MKYIILVLSLFFINLNLVAQQTIDNFYEKKEELLILSTVKEFDGLPKEQLMRKVKNWAGRVFVNAEKVTVSETSDQIVFTYLDNVYNSLYKNDPSPWYIRIIIQAKDNKIRIQFFDDKNGYDVIGNTIVRARIHNLDIYFKNNGECKKIWCNGLMELKTKLTDTSNEIEKYIKTNEDNNKNNEW